LIVCSAFCICGDGMLLREDTIGIRKKKNIFSHKHSGITKLEMVFYNAGGMKNRSYQNNPVKD
jgi:hypothetical protein